MPLISPETLARDFWVHYCGSKDGSTVHTQHNQSCFFCSATEQQVQNTPPSSEE